VIPEGQDAGRNIEVLHRHVYRRPVPGAEEQALFTLPCASLALAVQQGLEAHKLLQSTLKRTREEEQQDSEFYLEAARRAFPKPKTEVNVFALLSFH